MKRRMISAMLVALLVCLCLTGCRETLEHIVATKPSFRGTVIRTDDMATLIEIDPETPLSGDRAYISFKNVFEGSLTEVQEGDKVVVYFDGRVLESSPLQIPTVYAVLPWEE